MGWQCPDCDAVVKCLSCGQGGGLVASTHPATAVYAEVTYLKCRCGFVTVHWRRARPLCSTRAAGGTPGAGSPPTKPHAP